MLKDIIAISGKPGLFKLVSSGNRSLIAEGLEDGKRFPVFGASQVSALQDIAIYTDVTEVPLKDVMQSTYEKLEGKQAEVKKANATELAAFMEQVLPNYDKDRVYASDMKKLFSWYNILLKHNILPLAEEAKEDTEKE